MTKIKDKIQILKNYFFKTKKGSILAYSLIILAMMIAIVTTMSMATILEKKSASSTNFSVQAYQTADSGVQLAIKKINDDLNGTLSSVFNTPASTCNQGVVSNLNDAGAGLYDLSFYDASETKITNCSSLVNNVRSIKSVGKFKDTVRAVSVAVAAGGLSWQSATLQNGWVNYGNPYYDAVYAKDNDTEIVYLRGVVKNGAINSCVFTLPGSYIPPRRILVTVANGNGIAVISIFGSSESNPGCAYINNNFSTSNSWLTLDGISFPAD